MSTGVIATSSTRRRAVPAFLLLFLLVLAVAVIMLGFKWPFTQPKITAQLERATQSTVTIGKFRRTFFPVGCVAEDVTFRASKLLVTSSPIRVKTLTMQATLSGLLMKHVALIHVEGADIETELPPRQSSGGSQKPAQSQQVIVERLVLSNSVLQVIRNGHPSKFAIHEFSLTPPMPNQVMQYEAALSNPKPGGEIHAAGSIGPWLEQDAAATHISGSYSFNQADLGDIHGLGGIADSSGQFQGTFNDLKIEGRVITPGFEVNHTGHRIPVSARFVASVNATSGVVALNQFTGAFSGSTVLSYGSIHDPNNEQRPTDLAINVTGGRIQDFLYLVLKSPNPSLVGILNFKGTGTLPGQLHPFLKQVGLTGDFSITNGELTNQQTQRKLDDLSQRARGEKDNGASNADPVSEELRGHIDLKGGVASLTNVRVHVPGSVALLSGTYNLLTKDIDLRGRVLTRVTLSKETSGMKSFILKMVGPFLKKNRVGGAVIPITITGKYPHPIYKTDPM